MRIAGVGYRYVANKPVCVVPECLNLVPNFELLIQYNVFVDAIKRRERAIFVERKAGIATAVEKRDFVDCPVRKKLSGGRGEAPVLRTRRLR